MLIHRRGLLIGLAAALAAPAIVHAENLMPVRRVVLPPPARLFRVTAVSHSGGAAYFLRQTGWTMDVELMSVDGLTSGRFTTDKIGGVSIGDLVEITR